MNASSLPNVSAGRHALESTAVGLGALVLLAAFWQAFFAGRLPGDLGDARFNQVVLEHGFHWLSGRADSFWNASFFYPAVNIIAYSDSHIGTLPIFALLRWAGLEVDSAFLWWFHICCAASFASCHFVLRRLDLSAPAAMCGAFVFAFSMPVWAQINHVQLMPRFFIPFGFLFLLRLFERREGRYWYGLLAAVVAQLYCGVYMGYFLVFCLAATALPLLIRRLGADGPRAVLPRRPVTHLVLTALLLTTLLPLAIPHAGVASELGLRSWEEIATMLPRAISYVHAPDSLTWGAILAPGRRLPMRHEHVLFMGVLPLLALAAMILRDGDRVASRDRILLSGLLLAGLLTLYWGGHSPYRLVTMLPGTGSVRAVTRVVLVLLFPVAYALARATDIGLQRVQGPAAKRWAVGLIVLFCCAADQRMRLATYPAELSRDCVAQIRTAMANSGGDVFWVYSNDPDEPLYVTRTSAMLAAQELGVRLINGYTSNIPPGYPPDLTLPGPQSRAGVERWISLHPAAFAGLRLGILEVPPCGQAVRP